MTEIEIWKTVPMTDEKVQVSNMGRIRSIKKHKYRYIKGWKQQGYINIDLRKYEYGKTVRLHRLVARAFKPEEEFEGAVIDHVNCDKSDNRASNLEWVTQYENLKRGWKNKLFQNGKGQKCHASKLDDMIVLTIRTLPKEYDTIELSKLWNVSRGNIYQIRSSKTWTHLPSL